MKPHRFKFQAQFVEDVRAGIKRCTIRGDRKRVAKAGERALLEYWTARPYGSPVGQIGETELTRVTPIQIHHQLGRPLGIRVVRGGVELDRAAAGWNYDDLLIQLDAMTAGEDHPPECGCQTDAPVYRNAGGDVIGENEEVAGPSPTEQPPDPPIEQTGNA